MATPPLHIKGSPKIGVIEHGGVSASRNDALLLGLKSHGRRGYFFFRIEILGYAVLGFVFVIFALAAFEKR